MSLNWALVLVLLGLGFGATSTNGVPQDDDNTPYDFLYNEGIEKYLKGDWESCVQYFEMALNDWHFWESNVIRCRNKCASGSGSSEELLSSNLTEDDKFFERAVRSTLCLVKCKKGIFGSRMDRITDKHIDEDFNMGKPYDYLQLCYYKLDKLKEAADAAATVLTMQPEHEVMKNNLKFYLKEGEIKAEDVINKELKLYGKTYIAGNTAYNLNDYAETIRLMEESVLSYYEADNDCRRLCESPFDQGWFPDFISSIANHYTFTLRCKRRCAWQLSNLFGEHIEKFFATYFNYLQYSYYQEANFVKACEAVASALVMDPENEEQLRNKHYYLLEDGVTDDMFVPRKDVLAYKKKLDYEEKMMHFIETNFVFFSEDEILEDVDDIEYASTAKEKGKHSRAKALSKKARAWKRESGNQFKNVSQMEDIRVVMEELDLGGPQRVVADDFASTLECMILVELIKLASQENSGYKGGSPHTPAEKFHGVTLGRIGLMVHAKLISEEVLNLALEITDYCRLYLEQHFKLDKPLYFTFTHLVGRTAKPDESANRSALDLSHEIHVDNCILQESGACLRIPPAYTFRDYSAILYLNQDFKGGEFIFTKDRTGASYEGIVKPQCGRMVGFSAGPENPHGVLPVLEGSRFAIGMWFTHNEKHAEVERSLVKMLLKKTEEG